MSWAKLDDGFHNHPKVLALGKDLPALSLWVLGLSYCAKQRTDGVITLRACNAIVTPNVTPRTVLKWAYSLVKVGLWHPEKRRGPNADLTQKRRGPNADLTRWRYHDYDDYNIKDRTIRKRVAANRARQKRYRENRRRVTNGVTNASPDALANALVFAPVPSRPDPKEKALVVRSATRSDETPASDFALAKGKGSSYSQLPPALVAKLHAAHPEKTPAQIMALFAR